MEVVSVDELSGQYVHGALSFDDYSLCVTISLDHVSIVLQYRVTTLLAESSMLPNQSTEY